jgi:hypothetical protein
MVGFLGAWWEAEFWGRSHSTSTPATALAMLRLIAVERGDGSFALQLQ